LQEGTLVEKKPLQVYLYRSPFGTMTIRPDVNRPDIWFLVYEALSYASNGERTVQVTMVRPGWSTAEAAAEAVRAQRTGWRLWDSLPFVAYPATLEDWTLVDSSGTTAVPPPRQSE
jgi:hypothetical protein